MSNFDDSEADVLCSRCGTNLPGGSQFCLNCGERVASPVNSAALATIPVAAPPSAEPGKRPRLGRIVLGVLVAVLLAAALWAGTSESPEAQQVQEFVRWSHAETIVDTNFSVNPRGFSSGKFTVPQGALNVTLTGDFSAAASPPDGNENRSGKESKNDHDPNIEAYVLTDGAFAVWSSGYSTPTLYESGPIAGAIINAPLPAGAGVYHLVFSNKNSSRAKTVHAAVLLRYKSWMPDAVVRVKDRFWNWIGL
jgi:hypothetical protein